MNKCPVCGYSGLYEPAYSSTGKPSFEICASCGTEFGYDDAKNGAETLREKWIAKGMTWHFSHRGPPPNWNPARQLKELNSETVASRAESPQIL